MIIHSAVAMAAGWTLAATCFLGAQNAPKQDASINQDSLILRGFDQRTDAYVKLRKRAQASLAAPKSESSAASIKQYQQVLAQKIRAERTQAKAGDVFTRPVSELFRRLIAIPLQSSQGGKIRASLRNAEPVHGLTLEVNQGYPQTSALQSTPPTLLLDLPKLPSELEYRLVGRELVLLDTAANLIVDLLPDALPVSQNGR